MKPNYRGDKRRKEELRKKKQEEKRNKRLNKQTQASLSDPLSAGTPASVEIPAPFSTQHP